MGLVSGGGSSRETGGRARFAGSATTGSCEGGGGSAETGLCTGIGGSGKNGAFAGAGVWTSRGGVSRKGGATPWAANGPAESNTARLARESQRRKRACAMPSSACAVDTEHHRVFDWEKFTGSDDSA